MKIDFHTHILPAVDDGSSSIEESVELLKMQKQRGVSTVVATPHFYPHRDKPERFLERRNKAFQKLQEEIAGQQLPEVILGAEVYYFNGISQWEGLKDLTIGETNYLLLEMPGTQWTDRMLEDINGIYIKQGIIPIIAHIERYISFFNWRKILKKLAELQVVIQVNGSFFLEHGKFAFKMLKEGYIDIIASDCHNTTSRKPNLHLVRELIDRQLGEEYLNRITLTEQTILSKTINSRG